MPRFCAAVLIALAWILAPFAAIRAADAPPDLVLDVPTAHFQPGKSTTKDKKTVPSGTVERVDGKFGKAVKFSFIQSATGGFITAAVHPTGEWDRAQGFSFWVKGDGSESWGGLELIDRDNFSLRYGYCFPIDSTDWRKITVRWSDLTPELAGPMVKSKTGYAPSHFGNLWFGKWFSPAATG